LFLRLTISDSCRFSDFDRDRLRPTPQPRAGQLVGQTVRGQLTAACAGLMIVVLLWTFGSGLRPRPPHPGARSRAAVTKLWDKHQDLARAVAAILSAPSRRPPNSPTRIGVSCTAIRLASAGYRLAGERRPVTLAPHLSQIHLRAPPPVLA
jgi:hypothetical protein